MQLFSRRFNNPSFFQQMKVGFVWVFAIFMLLGWSGCTDPCKNIDCQNGGTCVEGVCECTQEYEGRNCENLSISRYLGTYSAVYSGCFSAAPGQTVGVDQATSSGFSIQFIGLGDYQCPGSSALRVNANVTDQGIVIPEQIVCEGGTFAGYMFTGNGVKTGNTITLDFNVKYDADGSPREDQCSVTLTEE